MLKKIAALAFALAVTQPLAPSAKAWDEVCVHFPIWKAAFLGNFGVVHGFSTAYGRIPNSYHDPDTNSFWKLPDDLGGWHGIRAGGAIMSGTFGANDTRCVSIRHLPEGEPFFVFVDPDGNPAAALCSTHGSNPNQWYLQQNRPYRKIWWEAGGAVWSPYCNYWRETN